MTRKKRTKNSSDLNELLVQAARTGTALAEKGLSWAEREAKEKRLFKTYPYLGSAFANVRNVIGFIKMNVAPPKTKRTTPHARRKKGHKKISK